MPRTHEVPNHINVEDRLLLGLNARQVATFMAFASPAYGVWDQLTLAPLALRGALAALLLVAGVIFALVQPGNRPLEEWMFALLAYSTNPRTLRWRREEPEWRDWRTEGPNGWADLSPWLRSSHLMDAELDPDDQEQ
jgi:hypothetical protein